MSRATACASRATWSMWRVQLGLALGEHLEQHLADLAAPRRVRASLSAYIRASAMHSASRRSAPRAA